MQTGERLTEAGIGDKRLRHTLPYEVVLMAMHFFPWRKQRSRSRF